MKAFSLTLLALLGGCVLFAEPLCYESSCPDGLACRPDGACYAECNEDAHCREGYFCDGWTCTLRCNEADCDGFTCDPVFDECREWCTFNSDCAKGYFCCDDTFAAEGRCEYSELDECLPK